MGSICYLHSFYPPSSFYLPSIKLLPNIQFPRDMHDPAPAGHPTPAYSLASARHLSNSCLPSSSYILSSSRPLSLCLGFSFSSRLIVLSEVARVEEVGSSEVGSWGKVSLLDCSASRCRDRLRRGGLWLLAIKAGSRSCHQGVYHQGGCAGSRSRSKAHQPRVWSRFCSWLL